MCDCHPRTPDDEKVWRSVKDQPATKEEWAFLHDCIERYRMLRIENHRKQLAVLASSLPQKREQEEQT